MAPFTFRPIIEGFKQRIESILYQGDRLYLGTSTGSLHVYTLAHVSESENSLATLMETKTNLTKRAIEQLGYIKDINSIVTLSDSIVSLHSLPILSPSISLPQTRGAMVFAIDTSVQHIVPDGKVANTNDNTLKGIPTVVTYLAVGCKRKIILYSWKDGESQGVKEVSLPHTPRAIAFCTRLVLVFAYTATDHALFSIETLVTTEFNLPAPASGNAGSNLGSNLGAVGMGMNALSGLGGYMTLGLGSKAKPSVIKIGDGEVMIPKENSGLFFGPDGKTSRSVTVEWPAPPEESTFIKPYIISTFAPGLVPAPSTSSHPHPAPVIPSSVVQVRSSISLEPSLTVPLPPPPNLSENAAPPLHTLRLLTSTSDAKSPLFVTSAPLEKAAALVDGTSVWMFVMEPWGSQVDELVDAGSYGDALALLDTIDKAVLPDKDHLRAHIRGLNAVSMFSEGKFDEAMNSFIELEVNPAKVIALYPESIAGRLSVPRDAWITLFGGKPVEPSGTQDDQTATEGEDQPVSSIRTKLQAGLDLLKVGSGEEIKAKPKDKPDDFKKSVEVLLRYYLNDRRPKISGALAHLGISPSQSPILPALSETSTPDLLSLPDGPLPSLTPEQLLRFAQMVDTAFFKSYLAVLPSLLGSLCRIDNWCDVEEVEELLRENKKFAEMVFLYHGKKMHDKALALLKELSEEEAEMAEKVDPTIRYLQKLGPEHLDTIFAAAKWVFEMDATRALQIFTFEDVALPPSPVADYLESIDPKLCINYIERLIHDLSDQSPVFHDRLIELYLNRVMRLIESGDEDERTVYYKKLLEFMNFSTKYSTDRLFSLLPTDQLLEARAILLGRLGKHEGALELYVNRLGDYATAEEYCKRIYQTDPDPRGVFLTLLRIYLRGLSPSSSSYDLLRPTLDLISRHSTRLDAVETLQLLPPLVLAEDARKFLSQALKLPLVDTRLTREIWKARSEQVSRQLMTLQTRRVRVTDVRICPQCHKRLGNSVIAVHAPRGEVTHYQCREAFSKRLNE